MNPDEIRVPGSCPHRPISNGWSQSASREAIGHSPYSWCGHCKAYIEHDAEWAAKFAARVEATS